MSSRTNRSNNKESSPKDVTAESTAKTIESSPEQAIQAQVPKSEPVQSSNKDFKNHPKFAKFKKGNS